ncbi:MAG: 50S ribosomal protein L10 [bacterium]|nr:50S ribosomal protein L10 [bacterium]
MPISKQAKKDLVASLTKEVSANKEQILVGYKGLTVVELEELRAVLRKEGVRFAVIKNSLLERVLSDAKIEGIDPANIKKPLALVIGNDEVMPAKLLVDFAKKHNKLELVAGVIDLKAVGVDQLNSLAALPTRDQLMGTVVGTIAAPLSGFVRVLAGTQRSLVYVLKALAESKS